MSYLPVFRGEDLDMTVDPVVGDDKGVAARSRYVHDGFVASASRYDWLNRVFAFGLESRWRRACIESCALHENAIVLDVATGTGDLLIGARESLGTKGVAVGLDFCRPMLEQGRRKAKRQGNGRVLWIEGRAERLPVRDAALDCVTLGFALRHLHLDGVLQEVLRVLRPGGRFVVVEWTRPDAVISRLLSLGYMRWVVAPLVRLVSRDRLVGELAGYLPETIERFMTGKALAHRFEVAGFRVIKLRSYFFGLVSLCVGLKGHASDKLAAGKMPSTALQHADAGRRALMSGVRRTPQNR